MGTNGNEEVTSLYSFSCRDRRFSKHIHDNVHGNIYLDPVLASLPFPNLHSCVYVCVCDLDLEVSTLEYGHSSNLILFFWRLRELKQLGLTHMVYPGAVHSRFEHSLGVYWLAGEAVHTVQGHQGSEINIERNDIRTVKLAGLLHDVGHGPFSHLFEREFLPRVLNGSEWSHEDMSVKMIDYIVDAHHIEIDAAILNNVKEMVLASSANASQNTVNEKRFLYDIVANGRNGIDVDKFDYIVRDSRACGLGCNFQFQRLLETMRVMGDEIYLTVHKLFATRADLHRTVYTHAKVKAIELMVVDALTLANGELSISASIQEPAKFWKLDDSILRQIETSDKQELKKARDLVLRIRRRDLYQFCNEFAVPKDKQEHFKDITPQDIVCSQKNGDTPLNEEDISVSIVKIDLTRGRSNPLERFGVALLACISTSSIKFFQDYESDYKFPIRDERISHLLPAFCQDMIVRVYSKKPELLKTYGMKAQVHDTPEKKKRRV
ncbi:deoxynucleoside triphosphate triphosphohydrolase SAMHD1-like protein isoform X3 [Gossypium australe]|uniref:Deoxynucleoside triphosphate triphosphohydrolase SAMHD1-like protein isoform X3 n=1 Tax=Gossypium australe TaxID=47621 RepID=A0A5B6WNY9_9ROSI|nr:deoxynucleoside triphosphate triphosphohydrolase SAMHD1-like protein isoform X3 [Gossypium australe]